MPVENKPLTRIAPTEHMAFSFYGMASIAISEESGANCPDL
jgi:hypothetical protein